MCGFVWCDIKVRKHFIVQLFLPLSSDLYLTFVPSFGFIRGHTEKGSMKTFPFCMKRLLSEKTLKLKQFIQHQITLYKYYISQLKE